MEATIKTLATKDDIASVRDELAKLKYDLSKQTSEAKVDFIKWMFTFWMGQIAAMLAMVFLFVKK
ncbi:MAG TPA: hypothetical protein VGN20_28870 [Mucilaginibacter sp.]